MSAGPLGAAEAAKQISQMVGFIRKEAEERAADIKRETESEASAKFLDRERAMKTQLKEEYARKKKDMVINQRKERSKKKNDSRIDAMREREKIVNRVKSDVFGELAQVSANAKYADLIRFLIAEGLTIIAETNVVIQCRKEDEAIVRGQLAGARTLYLDFVKAETGVTAKVELLLSNEWLPPAPRTGEAGLSCCGGVVLSARNGTIICKNTLDSRLELSFEKLKPAVRGLLFGVRERLPDVESEIDKLAAEHHAKLISANAKLAAERAGGAAAAAAAGGK